MSKQQMDRPRQLRRPRPVTRTALRQGRRTSHAWQRCLLFLPLLAKVHGFSLVGGALGVRGSSLLASGSNSNDFVDSEDAASSNINDDEDVLECSTEAGGKRERQVSDLKVSLLKVAAAHDRGFGAGPAAHERAVALIQSLELLNPESFASRGIDGPPKRQSDADIDWRRSTNRNGEIDAELSALTSPLTGCWKMIWTTAWDVLSLEASPFTKTAAIYQVYDPPTITNVIDVLPKIQSAFPPSMFPSSLLRLQVETRGSSCPPVSSINDETSRNRIQLEFRSVQVRPLQLLGTTLDVFPPLNIGLPSMPRISDAASAASTSLNELLPASILNAGRSLFNNIAASDPPNQRMERSRLGGGGGGSFDVTYLDEDLLVIRQQGSRDATSIGGLFVLIRVDSMDP